MRDETKMEPVICIPFKSSVIEDVRLVLRHRARNQQDLRAGRWVPSCSRSASVGVTQHHPAVSCIQLSYKSGIIHGERKRRDIHQLIFVLSKCKEEDACRRPFPAYIHSSLRTPGGVKT